MARNLPGVAESSPKYRAVIDDDDEHRFAEYEYEYEYENGDEATPATTFVSRRA